MTAVEALNTPRAARLTSQDFMVLVNSGAFDNYARAELIEGEIFVVTLNLFQGSSLGKRRACGKGACRADRWFGGCRWAGGAMDAETSSA